MITVAYKSVSYPSYSLEKFPFVSNMFKYYSMISYPIF